MSDQQLRRQTAEVHERAARERQATLDQAAHYRQLRATQLAAARVAAQQSGS